MCLENRPRRSEKVYYHGDNGSLGCVDWIHGWSEAGIFLLPWWLETIMLGTEIQIGNSGSYSRWIRDFPDDLVLRKRRASSTAEPDYQLSVAISRFSRPVLRATVAFPDDDPSIALYVAHLKSKLAMRLDDEEGADPGIRAHSTAIGSALSTIRRTAEAAALRVLLNGTMRDTQTPVAVLGDLNDGDRSVVSDRVKPQFSERAPVERFSGAV